MNIKVYLVDDELPAIRRLRQLLEDSGRVEIVGHNLKPRDAVNEIRKLNPDVLFLDIEMPEMSGFELLEELGDPQPLVVFATAYDRYALNAFDVNSIDYLLKPIAPAALARALKKIERTLVGTERRSDIQALLSQVKTMIDRRDPEYLVRVPYRVGERVEFIDVANVTHFYAKDKVTFAASAGKDYLLDLTISEMESRLPQDRWIRIHRSTLLSVDAVKELRPWFAGKLLVKLKDGRTELHVARERAAEVRSKLGL